MAYGLTTAIQNGGLALFPLVAAAIYKVKINRMDGSRMASAVCVRVCVHDIHDMWLHALPLPPTHPPLFPKTPKQAADSHYLPSVEWLFVGLALLGVCCGLLLNALDAKYVLFEGRVDSIVYILPVGGP